jgi:hypothetical protein
MVREAQYCEIAQVVIRVVAIDMVDLDIDALTDAACMSVCEQEGRS